MSRHVCRSSLWWGVGVAVLLAARAHGGEAWPPFLPPAHTYPRPLIETIERIWRDPTLRRTVDAQPTPVPFPMYAAFVDAPGVTAAAARHLGLARYTVSVVGDDWYVADDGEGASGVYHVLVREGGRRVVVSWGRHTSALLGTVTGSALTIMDLEDLGASTGERLTAHVLIDSRPAALLARVLVAVFGFVADRKLTEGFRVTGRVAVWARERPDEFCEWLAGSGLKGAPVDRVRETLGRCHPTSSASARPAP